MSFRHKDCFGFQAVVKMFISDTFLVLSKHCNAQTQNYHGRNVDIESARCSPPKARSPTAYVASKGEKKPAHCENNMLQR